MDTKHKKTEFEDFDPEADIVAYDISNTKQLLIEAHSAHINRKPNTIRHRTKRCNTHYRGNWLRQNNQ
jgi:hypothetical protein